MFYIKLESERHAVACNNIPPRVIKEKDEEDARARPTGKQQQRRTRAYARQAPKIERRGVRRTTGKDLE